MAATMPVRTNYSPDKPYSDMNRWVCIYPAYINSKKSRQEGRRIPKDKCVENPTYMEIRDVLSVTNLRIGVENKQYSRERSRELQFRGRIRVQIKNDDGSPCNPELTTRDSLLNFVAGKIPQLKSRQNKSSDSFQSTSAPATSTQAHHSGGGGHKKGKGKRR